MAQASRKLRRTRRLKRERTIAYRMIDQLVKERSVNRGMINYLIEQLPKQEVVENPVDSVDTTQIIDAVAATDWTTEKGVNE